MCVVRALANGISDELFPNSILIHALMKIEYICAYTIQHFFFFGPFSLLVCSALALTSGGL